MSDKFLNSLDFYSQNLQVLNINTISNIERVRTLDLSCNNIKDLSSIVNFSNLHEIILDSNNLNNKIVSTLAPMSTICLLSINKNNIMDLDELLNELDFKLPNLEFLSMLGNPACPDQLSPSVDYHKDDYSRFKLYVLYRLPKLCFLNFQSICESERKEAKLKGPYLKIIRPQTNYSPIKINIPSNEDLLFKFKNENLTSHQRKVGGCYEKRCQIYIGKNSEGNRFITNKDL